MNQPVTREDVEAFIAEREREVAPTIRPVPSPTGFANMLQHRFGDTAVPAARELVAAGEAVPGWAAIGLAIYLAQSDLDETNEPVARLAATTSDDEVRRALLTVLVKHAGPAAEPALRAALEETEPHERHPNAQPAIEAALHKLREGHA